MMNVMQCSIGICGAQIVPGELYLHLRQRQRLDQRRLPRQQRQRLNQRRTRLQQRQGRLTDQWGPEVMGADAPPGDG